jgi:N-acetylmuramoyl-L-alanine amidase
VETIALPKQRDLAQRISFAISAVLGLRVRGEAGYIDQTASARGKLGFVTAGGLIAELCFISNQSDLVQLQSNMHRVASAIAGVLVS